LTCFGGDRPLVRKCGIELLRRGHQVAASGPGGL